MHCFDCAEQNATTSAVGTCSDCGVGVCAHHARTDRRPITCRVSVGMVPVHTTARQTTRIVRCPSCSQARTAVAACEAQGGRNC